MAKLPGRRMVPCVFSGTNIEHKAMSRPGQESVDRPGEPAGGQGRSGRDEVERPMAGSVNKVILVGNLGRDPEVRRLNSGEPLVNLRIATSETWKDKASGERKEKTEWHSVVIFNENLARVAEQYLKKGSKVYLEGQLQTRKWTDQQGVEKYSTEVVLQ